MTELLGPVSLIHTLLMAKGLSLGKIPECLPPSEMGTVASMSPKGRTHIVWVNENAKYS